MADILQVALNGLTLAAVYFLAASGLTLIFGLMRVITLAHGTSFLLGGYLTVGIAYALSASFVSALGPQAGQILAVVAGTLAAAALVGVLGLVVHQGLIRRFQNDDMRVALVTLGVAIIGTDQMAAVFGGTAQQVPLPQSLQVAKVALPGVGDYSQLRLGALAIAVVIGVLLALLINRTRFGSIVRAGVDDSRMTAATGVNVKAVFVVIFVLGSVLASIAGSVNGSLFTILPGQDGQYLLYSLVVVIVGGMGSIAGAAIGAVLVGLISQFALVTVPTYSLVLTFALMVVVLAFRPQGIAGRAVV